MPGKHTNTGAKRAREARTRWRLPSDAPLPCVLTVAEHCAGLPVVVAALPAHVAGCLWEGRVIWVNGRQAPVRRRFTVAHELGHHCCGHEGPGIDSVDDLRDAHDPHEVQANAFAAELLAPEPAVAALIGGPPTLEDVVRIAARFGISAAAAVNRLRTLQLVAEARAEALAAEIEEGLHHAVAERLALPEVDDVLAEVDPDDLPRIPPALRGHALGALLRGQADVAAASAAAGVAPARLADALRTLEG